MMNEFQTSQTQQTSQIIDLAILSEWLTVSFIQ